MLGLRFCARAFSSCGKWGPLFIAVRGPLTIAACLVAEHRLQTRRLSNCGSRTQPLRGMWDPPRPGLEPVCPASAGRFSTTAPPGKPYFISWQWIIVIFFSCFLMCLIILDWMSDIACKRTVETEVDSIYTYSGHTSPSLGPLVWEYQVTLSSSWSGLGFYCWYCNLQYTTALKFIQWWTAATLCLVSGLECQGVFLSVPASPSCFQQTAQLYYKWNLYKSCPSLSSRDLLLVSLSKFCGWGRQCFPP